RRMSGDGPELWFLAPDERHQPIDQYTSPADVVVAASELGVGDGVAFGAQYVAQVPVVAQDPRVANATLACAGVHVEAQRQSLGADKRTNEPARLIPLRQPPPKGA